MRYNKDNCNGRIDIFCIVESGLPEPLLRMPKCGHKKSAGKKDILFCQGLNGDYIAGKDRAAHMHCANAGFS